MILLHANTNDAPVVRVTAPVGEDLNAVTDIVLRLGGATFNKNNGISWVVDSNNLNVVDIEFAIGMQNPPIGAVIAELLFVDPTRPQGQPIFTKFTKKKLQFNVVAL